MFEKAKIYNSIVWKRKTPEWQSFAERQNLEFQCVEKPKFTIPIFGKAKNKNSNDWNRQNSCFLVWKCQN